MTCLLAALYFAPSTGRKMPCGQSRAGRPQGHRRADAEDPRLVGRGADDAAIVGPAAADDDRLAAQLGPVALLDGREERVEIDVEDRPERRDRHPPIIAPPSRFRPDVRARPRPRGPPRRSALGLDDDRHLGRQAAVDLDRDLVRAERLERLLEIDLVAVDLDAAAGQGVGDVLRR